MNIIIFIPVYFLGAIAGIANFRKTFFFFWRYPASKSVEMDDLMLINDKLKQTKSIQTKS